MSNRRTFLKSVGLGGAAAASATAADGKDDPGALQSESPNALPPVTTTPVTKPGTAALGVVVAQVSQRLLTKAERLFVGNVEGRITELLQNSRRAGAKKVWITCTPAAAPTDEKKKKTAGWNIVYTDDGHGLEDFGQLLALGHSGWDDDIEAAEDPAGAGFFALCPREVTAASRGKEIRLDRGGWAGMPVKVLPSDFKKRGLRLQFRDESWDRDDVEQVCRFSGVQVVHNGKKLELRAFRAEPDETDPAKTIERHFPELGCRVQLVPHATARNIGAISHGLGRYFSEELAVNFHGQLINESSLSLPIVSALHLTALVDLTGEPTELRMVLPARNSIIHNDAYGRLMGAIERMAFELVPETHGLPYAVYERGRELGFDLAEAAEAYTVGVSGWNDDSGVLTFDRLEDLTDPAARPKLRLNLALSSDREGRNLDLMAGYAYPGFTLPWLPVFVSSTHSDYGWARSLPQVAKMETTYGTVLRNEFDLHQGRIWLVDGPITVKLTIAANANDAAILVDEDDPLVEQRIETYEVPCAFHIGEDDEVDALLVTREFLLDVRNDDFFWIAMGGYDEDSSDDYDAQRGWVEKDLQVIRCGLFGPYEYARRQLATAVQAFCARVDLQESLLAVTYDAVDGVVHVTTAKAEHRYEPRA